MKSLKENQVKFTKETMDMHDTNVESLSVDLSTQKCCLTDEEYYQALLSAAIKAANFLEELMSLGLMPDPRAKEVAEVALNFIGIVNSYQRFQDPENHQIKRP